MAVCADRDQRCSVAGPDRPDRSVLREQQTQEGELSMQKSLKGKSLAALIAFGAGALALVVYLVYNLAIGKFTIDVFAMILCGVIFAAMVLLTNFKFAPVLAVLGYSLAIGFYINNRIIMFEEMINRITGMTERDNIFAVVVIIFVLLFVGAIAGVITSFAADKETAK